MAIAANAGGTGKIFCLIGLTKTLTRLVTAPLYNWLYKACLASWPALALQVSVLVFLLTLALAVLHMTYVQIFSAKS